MVGPCRAGRFGADVSPPQPAQDLLHPARRRRSRAWVRSRAATHLAPFLPGHRTCGRRAAQRANGAVSAPVSRAAPCGSASILPISWMYIAMMGRDGLARRDRSAILAANYIAHRLAPHYPVLYRGPGRPRRPRMHPRSAAAEGERGHRGRGRRQAPDRLWFPRADDELPGAWNADGRAHRERTEGRARPLLRRDDRHPRRDPRHRARDRSTAPTTR